MKVFCCSVDDDDDDDDDDNDDADDDGCDANCNEGIYEPSTALLLQEHSLHV